MLADLRFGFKLLLKGKGFTITALLTLALCIGANTAIFTVLRAVVLAPLPYTESGRLVTLYNVYPGLGVERGSNGVPDYLDRKQMSDVFESVALTGNSGYDIGAPGSLARIEGEYVTPEYFHVLGASPMLGRDFVPSDATYKNDRYAILSFGLWKEMFARDPGIVGRDIRLSGVPYRVVGVMPESFQPPWTAVRLWVPFAFRPEQTTDEARHSNSWEMIARLRPGVTVDRAAERIAALNKRNTERHKYRKLLEDARFGTRILELKNAMVRDVRPTLYLLQAAVAFVLLIGCVNVANLMLVRSNVRMKELAIRFSLGAGRWRLGRQLLTESLTLAVLGGLLGVFTAWGGVRLLAYLGTSDLPRGGQIRLDATALAFSAAVALLTGLIFGSVPSYHLMRRDLNSVFRSNERSGTAERRAMWTRSSLVVCQVALAFVLLIGSGLLTLSFLRVLSVSPGFQAEHVLTARISLPFSRYGDDAQRRNFMGNLLESLRALPGAELLGATSYLPFGGNNNASVITIVGRERTGERPPTPGWNIVDRDYFRAMGVPLLQGRGFEATDGPQNRRVAIIDQYMANRYWPKGDALGAQIWAGVAGEADTGVPFTIVGVVGNVKMADLAEQNPVGLIYFDYRQARYVPNSFHLVGRTRGEPRQLAGAMRGAVLRADAEMPLYDVKTMPERVSGSMRDRRTAMIVCLAFGFLALVLSALGIYGVLAYTVTQRTREFGIRIALGASGREVVGMVLGQGIRLAAIGLAAGTAGALLLTRLMATLLFEVKPGDPLVFAAVAAALMVVAGVAALLPSLRVIRIQPASALRYE